jgi:galactoside O-acetyltransferase
MRSAKSSIFVGSDCLIEGTLVTSSIEIGNDVLISYGGIIADSDNHSVSYSRRRGDLARWKSGTYDWSQAPMKPIRIERGAWLGARVIILKGVTVGEGSVVGAGSVVTRDVAPYTLVAGNPARLIREIPLNDR